MTSERWTDAADYAVRVRYPWDDTASIARDVGRSERSVRDRAHYLGLAKWRSVKAATLARNRAMRGYRCKQDAGPRERLTAFRAAQSAKQRRAMGLPA